METVSDIDLRHDQNLDAFIALGAEIINIKTTARYGWQFNDKHILQPGFMPITPASVVYIGINPSVDKPVNPDEEIRLYRNWGEKADLDSYLDAYRAWAGTNLQQWNIYRSSARKIVEPNGIHANDDAIGWLNICKAPGSSSSLTEHHIRRDLGWLKRQLKMMPEAFIILGTTDKKYVVVYDYLMSNFPREQWACVGTRDSNNEHAAVSDKLAAWLRR